MNSDFVKTLVNHIEEGIIITQPDFRILLINKSAMDIAMEITGKVLVQQDDARILFENPLNQPSKFLLDKIISEKQADKIFIDAVSATGGKIFLEINFIPILNQNNQPDHFEFIINNITQQKLFENRLISQIRINDNFIKNSFIAHIQLDTRGYITEWNKFVSIVTGYKNNDVYTKKLVDKIIPETHKQKFNKLIEKTLNKQEEINYETPVLTSDQSTKVLLLSFTQRISVTGEVIGVTLMGPDITELSQYRKSLEKKVDEKTSDLKHALEKEKEVVEMKNRFVSIASHEFRTPLSSIQFNAAEVKKNKAIQKSSRLVNRIQEIEKHAERMTLLLDDVLTYSKSEPGKIKLIVNSIDLPEFLNKTSEEVYRSSKETHVIKKEFINLPSHIYTDEKLIRNVLINLLTNAIKYSPGKSHVLLTVKEYKGQLEIAIKDEGIGIPREDISSIFEPFNRSLSAAAIPGTGLGLSIVKRAIDLLNGSIRIDSHVNLGTEVFITIPLKINEN